MRNDHEIEIQELQRRMDVKIHSAAAAHMNNTKWREVLRLLRGQGAFRWKFVGNDRVYYEQAPRSDYGLREKSLGDVPPYFFGPYREIEWIEVSFEQAESVQPMLDSLGQLPIVKTETGVRVIAYTWTQADRPANPKISPWADQPGA
jgi:hypothetical protein